MKSDRNKSGKASILMKPPFLFLVYSQLSLDQLSDITGECKSLIVTLAFNHRQKYIDTMLDKIEDDELREFRINEIKEMIPIEKLVCDLCELTEDDYLETFTPERIQEHHHLMVNTAVMMQHEGL